MIKLKKIKRAAYCSEAAASQKPSPLGGRWRAAPNEGRTARSLPLPGNREAAKEEPAAPAAPTQEELLADILAELKKQNEEKTA